VLRDPAPSADLALRVFTGGIGEHAPAVYGEICHRLTSLRPLLRVSGISTGVVAGVRELTATATG
jgi:hypothetical protein